MQHSKPWWKSWRKSEIIWFLYHIHHVFSKASLKQLDYWSQVFSLVMSLGIKRWAHWYRPGDVLSNACRHQLDHKYLTIIKKCFKLWRDTQWSCSSRGSFFLNPDLTEVFISLHSKRHAPSFFFYYGFYKHLQMDILKCFHLAQLVDCLNHLKVIIIFLLVLLISEG